MRLFISWSGEQSRQLALLLREWIPIVLQPIRRENIWVSDRDLEPGVQWARVLGDVLGETRIGLVCLTHENRQAPWIYFESGVLARQLDRAKVIPVLFGLQHEDLAGSPLGQFQAVRLVKSDLIKMFQSLNVELKERRVADDIVVRSLEHNWAEFEAKLQELEKVGIREMEETLPDVIEVFSNRGLPEPHPGRIVHFEEGFESHTLYNIISEVARERILIFGRKNRKLFDKEHYGLLASLPERIGKGFDFRCLFLSPMASDEVLKTAHADDDLREQLAFSLRKACACLGKYRLVPREHFRCYVTHRTMNVIVVDDAVLFAPIEVGSNGRAKPLTKCGFSVVDRRLSLGRQLMQTFLDAWEGSSLDF